MAKKLDQLILIDVESTCWQGEPPPGEVSEIIEIGICPVDIKTGEKKKRDSIMVKPTHSKVSAFCTKLTTITQDMVDNGMPFLEAIKILEKKYDTRNRTVGSYGDYDREMFRRNASLYGVQSPFGKTHLNIKNLAAVMNGWEDEVGMDECLKRMGLELEGTHHRGEDDAWNIASIAIKLMFERATDGSEKA